MGIEHKDKFLSSEVAEELAFEAYREQILLQKYIDNYENRIVHE